MSEWLKKSLDEASKEIDKLPSWTINAAAALQLTRRIRTEPVATPLSDKKSFESTPVDC